MFPWADGLPARPSEWSSTSRPYSLSRCAAHTVPLHLVHVTNRTPSSAFRLLQLLATCQAMEFLRPLKTTEPLEHIYSLVRSVVAPYDRDR